jgi:hypothetical protein
MEVANSCGQRRNKLLTHLLEIQEQKRKKKIGKAVLDCSASSGNRRRGNMMEQQKYGGLCLDCKNASTCTYQREIGWHVHQCNEHDAYKENESSVSLALLTRGSLFSASMGSSKSAKPELSVSAYKGLCRNCENLENCKFPKHEGGVWHCEEFK